MDTGALVAFVGLGAMGKRMASRLVGSGYLLTAWNRTPGRADELIKRGARVADNPRDAAAGSRVIVLMVSDPAAVAAVLGGDRGVLACPMSPARMICLAITSTIPDTSATAVVSPLTMATSVPAVAWPMLPITGDST